MRRRCDVRNDHVNTSASGRDAFRTRPSRPATRRTRWTNRHGFNEVENSASRELDALALCVGSAAGGVRNRAVACLKQKAPPGRGFLAHWPILQVQSL